MPEYYDDGRYSPLELIVAAGIFMILVVAAVWVTVWQWVGRLIVYLARRRVARAQAQAVPTAHDFRWFDKS